VRKRTSHSWLRRTKYTGQGPRETVFALFHSHWPYIRRKLKVFARVLFYFPFLSLIFRGICMRALSFFVDHSSDRILLLLCSLELLERQRREPWGTWAPRHNLISSTHHNWHRRRVKESRILKKLFIERLVARQIFAVLNFVRSPSFSETLTCLLWYYFPPRLVPNMLCFSVDLTSNYWLHSSDSSLVRFRIPIPKLSCRSPYNFDNLVL